MAAPLYQIPRIYPESRGIDTIEFAEALLRATRGFRVGQPVKFEQWQKQLIDDLFEVDGEGLLRFRTALVGLPRKNGKSMIGTAIALTALYWSDEGDQIYSVARDLKQAKIVFDEAKKQIEGNKFLRKQFRVYRDKIVCKRSGAEYRCLAADGMAAQGYGPSLVIADELHAWETTKAEELWNALTQGSGDRPESLVIGITTAGDNYDSLLGELYDMGVKTINGSIADEDADPTFGFFWWGAPEEADIFSPETWKQANPNLDLPAHRRLLSEKYLHNKLLNLKNKGQLGAFKRYHLNQWVRSDGEVEYLTEGQWNQSIHPEQTTIPKGAKIVVGFDGSLNRDSTGLVAIDMATGFIELLYGWEWDGTHEWRVPRQEVNDAVDKIFAEYDVQLLMGDQSFWQTDMDNWARKYPRKVLVAKNSDKYMVPLTIQFKNDLTSDVLWHAADGPLKTHFLNAIETRRNKVAKETPGSKRKIDYLVCAIIASGARSWVLGSGAAKVSYQKVPRLR